MFSARNSYFLCDFGFWPMSGSFMGMDCRLIREEWSTLKQRWRVINYQLCKYTADTYWRLIGKLPRLTNAPCLEASFWPISSYRIRS
jgi:hypothetical protein